MWDNGGRKIQLNEGELTDEDSRSRDSAFTVPAPRSGKGSDRLVGPLAKTWTRKPKVSMLSILDRLCLV